MIKIFSRKKSKNTLLKKIQITDTAQRYIENLLSSKPGAQIRIFILKPGTSHAKCGLSFYFPKKEKTKDFKLKFNKFCVYIDKISASFLQKTKIDLVPKDGFSYQLKLITQEAQKKEIQKESEKNTLQKHISIFLEKYINPQLEMHGGKVHMTKISKKMEVFVEFEGGCNGCHLASLTFKERIKKEIMENFPEITEVVDITDHKYGKHSFI